MKPNNEQQKNKYQEILKKIQAESKQKKQQRTINILRGESTKNKSYQPLNILQSFRTYLNNRQKEALRFFRIKQTKHIALLTVFLIFGSYMSYMIEKKYDTLRKKAQRTQTYKQRQVEKENQYIERMLRKKEFEAVPIPTELEEQNRYKFEEEDLASKGGLVIDTKQDLMDLISKDQADKSAQQIYEEQVKKARQRV